MKALDKARAKYDSKQTKRLSCKLNVKTDVDILDWLSKQPNKQGRIKQLIREQIRTETEDKSERD